MRRVRIPLSPGKAVSDSAGDFVTSGRAGCASALPKALAHPARPEVTKSPALSLTALPGESGIRTRRIAILAANGADHESIVALQAALLDAGAVPTVIAPRIGAVKTTED